MWERDLAEMQRKLQDFHQKWLAHQDFLMYFERAWIAHDKLRFWTIANQPNMHANMTTNNYVESWHNQLKTIYLQQQPNRRVDRLIYILVHDVNYDYEANVERIVSHLGRMGPIHHEERRRHIAAATAAESVPFVVLDERVVAEMGNDGSIASLGVQSFTRAGMTYLVTVTDSVMRNCECDSFDGFNGIACKHMHLCRRVHPDLQFPPREYPLDLSLLIAIDDLANFK